jgi:hypothetical protein
MSADRSPARGLLRWYPRGWRSRYGDELVALMEDELDGAPPSPGFRASVAVAGLRERARSVVVAGSRGTPEFRIRSGALVVLAGWTALVAGGAAFSKAAEHFADAQPAAAQTLSRAAYIFVAVLGATSGLLVVLGAAVALPATVRFLRDGGWTSVRRRVLAAVACTVAVVVVTAGLSLWAHHLDIHQRNGGDLAYTTAFLAWAGLAAVMLGLWAAVAVAVGRRIDLGTRAVRVEGTLAVLVTACMVSMTAAVAVWWAAMAEGAPWFLAGTPPGTRPSPVTVPLVLIAGLLVVACAVAVRGTWQALSGMRHG